MRINAEPMGGLYGPPHASGLWCACRECRRRLLAHRDRQKGFGMRSIAERPAYCLTCEAIYILNLWEAA